MLRKTLPSGLLLLTLLVASTYLTHAAGPPTPTPIPPQPSSGMESINVSITVRPDGTWDGEAILSFVLPPSVSSDPGEALDAQIQRGAAAIFGDRRIRYTWEKNLNGREDTNWTFLLEGEDAREITEIALNAGRAAEWLEGPVALELSGAIRAGQTLVIALPANPSTGYSWGVESPDRSTLPQVNDVETHQVSKGLGAPARQVIRFRAVKTGQTDLRLVYRRPWQADLPPTMVISIQANGMDLGEACATLSAPLPPPDLAPAFGIPNEGGEEEDLTLHQDTPPSSVQSLPSAYNWCDTHGGCPSVKDQGACGSCWAFATAGPLEAWIKYSDNRGSIDLAEQYLVSCNVDDWGCDGGWWAHDYHRNRKPPSESQAGAVLESGFPYVARDVSCGGGYSHPYRITSWAFVGNEDGVPSVAAIKQAIHTYGPVATGVCAGNAFSRYTGGVFQTDESQQCTYDVDHAIVLVGWDDSQGTNGVWILRNSWGTSWGESGYMRIGYGTSNVGYSANYIVYSPSVAISDWAYLPMVAQGSGKTYSLSNSGFESGRDGSWSEYSSNGWTLILEASALPTSVSPHGGNWAAWLGGDDDETSILSQKVTIPSNGTTLKYWYWSASEDLCDYDYAYVRFESSTLKTHNLCADNNTGAWRSQQIDVTSWQGQTVELRFVVETDWLWNSNLFLDDVSISTTTASSDLSIFPDASETSVAHPTVSKESR